MSVDKAVDTSDRTVTVTLPEVFASAGVPDPVVASLLGENICCASLGDSRPYNTRRRN